jgi:hypothetical protein
MKSSYRKAAFAKRLSLFVAAAVLLSFAGAADAGDCRNVKFHFKNEAGSKIKVRNVEIGGNDGTWTEDIGNEQILTNSHYTTNGRTLNKLDSGETPSFMTVHYDKWSAANNAWLDRSQRFTDRQRCDDGDTYNFVIQ